MSKKALPGRVVGLASVAAAVLVLGACSSSGPGAGSSSSGSPSSGGGSSSSGGSSSGATGGSWTAQEVAAATGAHKVTPLFAVPKSLPKKYRLAFLNDGKSLSFFASWSAGMNDAAKFYGVSLDEADLNFHYENELSLYQQLAVKQPDVVGANVMNEPVYQAITKNGSKLVMIDGKFNNVPNFGVSDVEVGQLSATTVEQPVKARLAGDWKGRHVMLVSVSAPNCTPCDTRAKAANSAAATGLGLTAADTTILTPPGQDPTSAAQSTFTDFLTSHPDQAVVLVYGGDESAVGALNAARAAGRSKDVLVLSNGGDETARKALRDPANATMLVGSVDYQPYSEGWNWVEAAIATAMGQSFDAYQVTRVLTPQNVDGYYPNDAKTGSN